MIDVDTRPQSAEPLEDVPDTWAWMTLGELLHGRGRTITPSDYPDQTFQLYSVPSHSLGHPEIVKGAEIGSSKQTVESGMVLLCKINPRINRVWVVESQSPYPRIASTEWIVFPPIHGVDPQYLAYFMRQSHFTNFLASNVSGVGGSLMRVSANTVVGYSFPLAPLNEQRRIVEAIETQFTRLDAGVAALKRVQANLKRYKASVLKAACEGKLVPQDPTDEPADKLLERVLAERRAKWEADYLAKQKTPPKDDEWKAKYPEPQPPDTSDLPELPSGWVWTSIGQVFEVFVGATPSRAKPEYWNGDIPWVSSGEVAFCRIRDTRERITELGLEHTSTEVHPIGTILLGMIGEGKTRGQTAILDIPACHNQNSAAIRVSEAGLPPEYVYYFLESTYEQTRRGSSGNNQPALNKSRVQAMIFPMPPLNEQMRIIAEIDRLLSLFDVLVDTVDASLQRAEGLRQSILRDAFAGRLVPQDPTDEPASELLERIRAERAQRKSKSS